MLTNRVQVILAERAWFSIGSSPLSYLFTSATVRIGYFSGGGGGGAFQEPVGTWLFAFPKSFRLLLSCATEGFCYLNLTGTAKFKYESKDEMSSCFI